MSAICMVRGVNGVLAAADGVFYGRDGRVTGFGSKIMLMPEMHGLMLAQGMVALLPELRMRIGFLQASFDGLLSLIEEAFAVTLLELRRQSGRETNAVVYLGGWSEGRQRFESYELASVSSPDLPAWTLTPAPAIIGAPWPSRDIADRFALYDDDASPHDFALRFLNCARHTPVPMDGQPGTLIHQVGGFVQVAFVGPEGCSSALVHRWPDVVGQMINPDAGAPAAC